MFTEKKIALIAIIYFLVLINSVIFGESHVNNLQDQKSVEEVLKEVEQYKEEQKIYNKIIKLENVNDYGKTDLRKLSKAIYKYSQEFNISSDVLIGIAYVESRANKYVSNNRCIGIYQINERVHKLNQETKYDEDYQVKKGCEILSYFIKVHNNDIYKALNNYNGRVNNNPYANKVMKIANLEA